jgi:cobalt-precorrin 5A hydrolase / cobalt-factor III methyltransferase / precorrin-3B C17-methyltransferase
VIALVAATAAGRARARDLAGVLPEARLLPGQPSQALPDAFAAASGIVLFAATGIAVRLLAPLLGDKRSDPGVVCVDDAGRFAVALTGGHAGGANRLAERVAAALGAQTVITTASEATGVPGLEALARDNGFAIDPASKLAPVAGALVSGERVALVSDRRRPLGPLPPNVVCDASARQGPAIVIDDRLEDPPHPAVIYRPPSLTVGVGASRGAGPDEILALIEEALAEAGLATASVGGLASVEAKAGEPGLLAAAEALGRPLRVHPAAALAGMEVPNPSEVVLAAVGTPSVAEAAALLEAGDGGELVIAKRRSAMATVAVARRAVRGRLAIVGLGPGDEALLPPLARRALARAELVVGLGRYVESIRHLLRPGTRAEPYRLGQELERCRRAVAEAAAGASVALVSGGDPGVYAMASPALEQPGIERVEVEVVPGVTAAHAAAALAGSPLGHDHCSISLSDLLTPWATIRERLRAAAEADFVVSLYNPRSRERDWQLEEAREVLLERRAGSTPVAVVSDAHRPAQRVTLSTLDELDTARVSMAATVIVGSSQTRMVDGRMVTPRGYRAAVEAAL